MRKDSIAMSDFTLKELDDELRVYNLFNAEAQAGYRFALGIEQYSKEEMTQYFKDLQYRATDFVVHCSIDSRAFRLHAEKAREVGKNLRIATTALNDQQIALGFRANGYAFGSVPDYIDRQIEQIPERRKEIVAYWDTSKNKLRCYYRV